MQSGILTIPTIDRSSLRPLYRQIYEGYRDAIVARRLRGGQQVPSTRALATELGISRISVVAAFEQLLAEGYFESRAGSGTFVATSLPGEIACPPRQAGSASLVTQSAPRLVAHRASAIRRFEAGPWLKGSGAFNLGQPPADCFPSRVWSKLVTRHSLHPDPTVVSHKGAMGLPHLREAVAEYLRTARAVRCETDQIMIVNGSQQALQIAAMALLDPGDPVWIEEPGYFGAQSALTLAGGRLVPVPVDKEGLDVAAGIAMCRRPRAIFVTPSHQYPLGFTMSASRRLRLLDLARSSGAWVIEDDYDSEYRYGDLPITSLQGLDRDNRVVYIGTFTKVLFTGLRLGYMVVPRDLLPIFLEIRRAMDFGSPTCNQAVLADFIREGHLGRHFRRLRLICEERRETLEAALRKRLGGALEIQGDRAGMYLTATLSNGLSDRRVAERAAPEGLWLAPLSECYHEAVPRQGLLLGYAGTDPEQIDDSVARLEKVILAVSADDHHDSSQTDERCARGA